MDIDPLETATEAADDTGSARDRSRAQLNTSVAITVALLATFLGVCKVKDDNIVQAMQQAEADRVDHWSFYQARNIREEVGRAELVQLKLAAAAAPAAQQAAYAAAIGSAEALVTDQSQKKEELRRQATSAGCTISRCFQPGGVIMGLARLFGWPLHPDIFVRLLS